MIFSKFAAFYVQIHLQEMIYNQHMIYARFISFKVGHGCGKTRGFWVMGVTGTGAGFDFGTPRTPRTRTAGLRVNYSRGQSNFYCFKTFFLSFFSLCHTVTQPKMALVSRASIFASHHQPALVSLPLPSLSTTNVSNSFLY